MERERGFALLMVLWTLILMAFLATVYADNTRTEVFLARNLVDNAQAEALADAGVYQAIAGLGREPSEGGFYGDGRVYVWPSDAGEVRFWIRDEGGKVDLNKAPAVLLREMLVVAGAEPKLAASLADAIVDFRDEDDDREPHGAEAREYRAAGLGYGPKNQRIALVDELIYVPGMTADLLSRLASFVTTFGQDETPHAPTASPEVRAAVIAAQNAARGGRTAGASARSGAGSSSESLSGRAASDSRSSFGSSSTFGAGSSFGRSSSFGSGSSFGSSSSFGADDAIGGDAGSAFGEDTGEEQQDRSGTNVFTVHSEARTLNGTVFVREAVVNLSGAEDQPFAFNGWQQGSPQLFVAGGRSAAVAAAGR